MRYIVLTIAALGLAPLALAQQDGGGRLVSVALLDTDGGATGPSESSVFTKVWVSTAPFAENDAKPPPAGVPTPTSPAAQPSLTTSPGATPGSNGIYGADELKKESAATAEPEFGGGISDPVLLKDLHASNLMAIAEASLAEDTAQSARVKKYAAQMKRAHERADKEVAKAANRLGVELSDALPPERTAAVAEVKDAQGADFDRTFLQAAASQQEVLIAKVDVAQKADPQVERLCDKLLPDLRELALKARHLELKTAEADVPSFYGR
jgi:putative membrane protein